MTTELETMEPLSIPVHALQPVREAISGPGPAGLTITVSREAGSRGGTIARRAAEYLGWQSYNQELLEYLAHEKHLATELFESLDQEALDWVEGRLVELNDRPGFHDESSLIELARVVLAIGVRGEAVILGRGAGAVLPGRSTLRIRVIAPLEDRVAYMSQLERLTLEDARHQVQQRDQSRASFIRAHFGFEPADPYQYDLLLNSSALGEKLASRLIEHAARLKQELLAGP